MENENFRMLAVSLLKDLDDKIGESARRMESGVIYSGSEFAQELGQIITSHNRKLVEYVLLSVECIDFDQLTIPEHVAKIVEHFADYENNSWHPPTP